MNKTPPDRPAELGLNLGRLSTAIFPNRILDKAQVEAELHLGEFGDETTEFWTQLGSLFAQGYVRVVYGDHGPYVEFRRDQIRIGLTRKFNRPVPPEAYYEWLTPADGSGVKVYDQKRDVRHLPSPPGGGFRGNRKNGYADYKVGFIYVAPFDLAMRLKD